MAHHYTFSVVKNPDEEMWGILATCSECGPQEIIEVYDSELDARNDLDNLVGLYTVMYGDEDTKFAADFSPAVVFPQQAVL